jgi:Lar family restriction alleviation protein
MAENPSTTNPVLKPCPFCGGSAFVNVFWAGAHFHEAKCSSCEAKSPPTEHDSEAEAIAAWNRRRPLTTDEREAAIEECAEVATTYMRLLTQSSDAVANADASLAVGADGDLPAQIRSLGRAGKTD